MSVATPQPRIGTPAPIFRIFPILGQPETTPPADLLLNLLIHTRQVIMRIETTYSRQYPWIMEYTSKIKPMLDEMITKIRGELKVTPPPRLIPPVITPGPRPVITTPTPSPRITIPTPTPIFRALPVVGPPLKELPLKTRIALRA